MLFLSFRAPLSPLASPRPICLFHGLVIHYSCRMGLMVLPSVCQSFAALVFRLSSFYLDSQKWPSTFSPLNIWSVHAVHMWIKDLPVLSSSLLSFPSRAILNNGPLLIYIYIYIYKYIYIYFFFLFFSFLSCREQCCLFEFPSLVVIFKHSCRFINFIPFWWLTGCLPSCWY